jgi:hypothetical protein
VLHACAGYHRCKCHGERQASWATGTKGHEKRNWRSGVRCLDRRAPLLPFLVSKALCKHVVAVFLAATRSMPLHNFMCVGGLTVTGHINLMIKIINNYKCVQPHACSPHVLHTQQLIKKVTRPLVTCLLTYKTCFLTSGCKETNCNPGSCPGECLKCQSENHLVPQFHSLLHAAVTVKTNRQTYSQPNMTLPLTSSTLLRCRQNQTVYSLCFQMHETPQKHLQLADAMALKWLLLRWHAG